MSRLAGRPEAPLQGIAAVVDAAFAQYDLEDGDRQMVAMTTVGAWTLMIEPNGYIGVTEDRALPASAGASWVSHFVNINAVGTFLWAEDQVLRLCFDPMFPEDRWGTAPDELLDVMVRIGFHLEDETPETDLPSSGLRSGRAPDRRGHQSGAAPGHDLHLRHCPGPMTSRDHPPRVCPVNAVWMMAR
ncbi:DUF6461 domain-containing protein [Streptomyces avidinii]|uniref:Sensory transduction regulator n=1 Tax=Streptomyces avidinii TaxID=1895 RepID=A0ABS4L7Y9_STRAV|nr:hypothetical protein [Streptomyces avidinii]GGZ13951.1 hypothetical protein GCM10010343_46100 [Streptomyces avidinii]